MKNFQRLTVLMGGIAGISALAACLVVGCSSEDTSVSSDAGKDQTTTDVTPGQDGGSDVQSDTFVVDAPDPIAFEQQVHDAICNRIKSCCGAGFPFSNTACQTNVDRTGGVFGETLEMGLVDGGRVAYDPVKGAQCIAAVAALDCYNNNSATMLAGRAACIGALTGKQAAGQPCRGSIECASGNFCNLPLDGGAGSCAALRSDGGPCGDFGSRNPESLQALTACSYRANGASGLTCVIGDYQGVNDAGTGYLQPGSWVCAPQGGDGGSLCLNNQDCTSGICDFNNIDQNSGFATCGTSAFLIDDAGVVCGNFSIQDAGGGG